MSNDTAQAAGDPEDRWYDEAPITDRQIEEAREYIERAMLPAVSRFVARKLLAEVERLRDLNAELSETLDVRLDETQRLRAKLATRADLMSGLDAEVDRLAGDNAKLRARLAEIGETREEFALRGDGGEAYCATREGALRVAEDWNRIRTDGPWRAEVRVVGQWREVPDA